MDQRAKQNGRFIERLISPTSIPLAEWEELSWLAHLQIKLAV
jgi:hypothetical protein